MPLYLEINREGKWRTVGRLTPGDSPGSISHNKTDGRREMYMFECAADDSHSTIYRSIGGADGEIGDKRHVNIMSGIEIITILYRGNEPYAMSIKTDRSEKTRQIRFSHV